MKIKLFSLFYSPDTEGKPYENYDELTFEDGASSKLENLESFSVENRFDPRLFWQILSSAPNLKSLSVKGFQV